MNTVNIDLSDSLQRFVDHQAAELGFETCGEYIQDLITRERDICRERAVEELRALLLEGANSPVAAVADDEFFDKHLRRLSDDEPQ